MEPELEELAASAARALLVASRTPRWREVALRVTLLLREVGLHEGWIGLPTTGGYEWPPSRRIMEEWQGRMGRLLVSNPGSAAELRGIVAEFGSGDVPARRADFCPNGHLVGASGWCPLCAAPTPAPTPAPAPDTTNTVSGGTVHGAVIQSREIDSVVVNTAPVVAGDHVDFGDGTFNGPTIGVQYNHYGPRPDNAPAAATGWPRVDQLRRLALGVHPTRRFGDEPSLPPYVPRDCHGELTGLVAQAVAKGGLVVVTGEPLSGKTMTAWAALRGAVADDTRVYAPDAGADLRDLPARLRGRDAKGTYVVWLDDLDGHLGEHGLTAGLLAHLTHEGILVLATMNDEAYDTHRFGGSPASRVLSAARTVEVPGQWSPAELARLAQADDPRLVDALRWRGERGVGEFLVIGPELWDEWRRARRPAAQPLGHLLVRAAIDLARCGIEDVPEELLEAVCAVYGSVLEDADSEAVGQALSWATEPRQGITGLLVSDDERGTWRVYGSLVADAVRSTDIAPVPLMVWLQALGTAEDDALSFDAVAEAARRILTPRAAQEDGDALTALGMLAAAEDDEEGAVEWLRKAADSGSLVGAGALGDLLFFQGRDAEAIPYLERAVAGDWPDVEVTLGRAHQNRAVHYLRRAEASGNADAGRRLKGPLAPPDQGSAPG
ncbi:tetratricopeptide repeat protein [Streptomyces sp. NPDC058644]|uniref:tetratricopeptide repeat protein n=1 Tax=unclassified Streptomyces TaxID=2593676 RepID=UPI003660E73E